MYLKKAVGAIESRFKSIVRHGGRDKKEIKKIVRLRRMRRTGMTWTIGFQIISCIYLKCARPHLKVTSLIIVSNVA